MTVSPLSPNPDAIIEVWPRRKWTPFEWTVYYHHGSGSGPFRGACWRVVYLLNGRPNPGVPEGVGWCRSEARAIEKGRARVLRNADVAVKSVEIVS